MINSGLETEKELKQQIIAAAKKLNENYNARLDCVDFNWLSNVAGESRLIDVNFTESRGGDNG